jgi:hypothetical protein
MPTSDVLAARGTHRAPPEVRDPSPVSISVAIEDLAETLAERGPDAYLVTVRGARPHVVQVSVAVQGGALVVAPGRRTASNIAERPDVTLLWPVDPRHPHHSLLVDGTARMSVDGEWLEITPTAAVLHRAGGRRRRLPPEPSP